MWWVVSAVVSVQQSALLLQAVGYFGKGVQMVFELELYLVPSKDSWFVACLWEAVSQLLLTLV